MSITFSKEVVLQQPNVVPKVGRRLSPSVLKSWSVMFTRCIDDTGNEFKIIDHVHVRHVQSARSWRRRVMYKVQDHWSCSCYALPADVMNKITTIHNFLYHSQAFNITYNKQPKPSLVYDRFVFDGPTTSTLFVGWLPQVKGITHCCHDLRTVRETRKVGNPMVRSRLIYVSSNRVPTLFWIMPGTLSVILMVRAISQCTWNERIGCDM